MQTSAIPSLDPNWMRSFLEDHAKGMPILLAVSGGLDSMVLWNLVEHTGLDYGVAHVNYHLRGTDSDADAQLIAKEAALHGTSLHVHNDHSLSKNSAALQAHAREVRYNFFTSLKSKYAYLCTAHHSDDQVETVLLQLGRGGGPVALAGISAAGNEVLRPLLPFSKAALYAYAKTNDVAFREDGSNASDNYLRNRLRHHLVPLADDLIDGFRQNLTKAASQQQALLSFASAMVRSVLQSLKSNKWPHALDRKELASIPGRSYFLHELLKGHGFLPETLRTIDSAIDDGKTQKRIFLNREESIKLVLTGQTLHLEQTIPFEAFEIAIECVGTFNSPLGKITVKKTAKELITADLTKDEILLPQLSNITWRTTLEADTICISQGKSKTAKRVLAEAKLPNIAQHATSVITANGRVLWMAGERKCISQLTSEAKTVGYHLRFTESILTPGVVAF